MVLDPYLTPHHKINSKWIRDLNVRAKTVKLLKESIGLHFYDFGSSDEFLNTMPKAQVSKEKKWKAWVSSKIKTFVHQRTLARK